MKKSNIAVWIFLLIALGIAACGGTETVVSSSDNNTAVNTVQADDNTDPIRLFDSPEDPNGGGGGGK